MMESSVTENRDSANQSAQTHKDLNEAMVKMQEENSRVQNEKCEAVNENQ
jgi:hypothetical protein